MAQRKQHGNGKRDFSDVTTELNNEPKRKRRKTENNTNDNDDQQWKCIQCTLINEATATKCVICNITKNHKFKDDDNMKIENDNTYTNRNDLEKSNSNSWGEDLDIDIDNFDGQKIYSLNNNDITNRYNHVSSINNNNNNKTSSIIKESTLNGLTYTECWLCKNCFAMNRLLDTISKYNYLCAFCKQGTYTTQTEIIKSFEWDHNSSQTQLSELTHSIENNNNTLDEMNQITTDTYVYNTKGLNNTEGDQLIMGMIHQNKVRVIMGMIPPDIIRLTLLFHGEFEYDGWDTFTNIDYFVIDTGLTTCHRTDKDKNLWRNCFGQRKVFWSNIINNNNNNHHIINTSNNNVRFEWKLKCVKRINKDWEDEPVESVIIGIIESGGIQTNMNSTFSTYCDGWGLCGDGQIVTDGKYAKFNSGFCHLANITIVLQWINNTAQSKCQLLFDNKFAYELNPNKTYKLAVAMNSKEYQLEWISFAKYNEIVHVENIKNIDKGK